MYTQTITKQIWTIHATTPYFSNWKAIPNVAIASIVININKQIESLVKNDINCFTINSFND